MVSPIAIGLGLLTVRSLSKNQGSQKQPTFADATQHTVEVVYTEGRGNPKYYEIEVQGRARPLGNTEPPDMVDNKITGRLMTGSDSYVINGSITDIQKHEHLAVYVDGERVDN